MNFIAILVPAILVALGIFLFLNASAISEKLSFDQRMVMCMGAALCLIGCYFEFFVTDFSFEQIFLRAVVILNAAAVVVAAAVAVSLDGSYSSYSENTCSAVFNARAVRNVSAVMTFVLASIVSTI